MPHPLELPGMLRAVIPLMGGEGFPTGGRGVIGEFVALSLGRAAPSTRGLFLRRSGLIPSFAPVVGTLNHLSKPAARLRDVNSIGIDGRSFEVINLPAGKMGTTDVPLFPFAIGGENKSTFMCTHQHPHLTHAFPPCRSSIRATRLAPVAGNTRGLTLDLYLVHS